MADRVVDGVCGRNEPEQATIAAIGQLYDRGYRRYLRVAEAIVRDDELARDVVQDAFARAIRGRFDFRGDASVDGWVWQIVVNTAKSAVSSRPFAQLPLNDGTGESSPNVHVPDGELRFLLASLPERQRLVLFLRYYADLDYRQIAEALEIQSGTVGATLSHAHTALRRALEQVPG